MASKVDGFGTSQLEPSWKSCEFISVLIVAHEWYTIIVVDASMSLALDFKIIVDVFYRIDSVKK